MNCQTGHRRFCNYPAAFQSTLDCPEIRRAILKKKVKQCTEDITSYPVPPINQRYFGVTSSSEAEQEKILLRRKSEPVLNNSFELWFAVGPFG